MDKDGIVPIASKFLQPNYLFALEFGDGWLFGRVVRRRICRFKPYVVIDESGNTVSIDSGSHEGVYRFNDPNDTDKDIVYLDAATSSGYPWFIHGSLGVKPSGIRVYLRLPEDGAVLGAIPNLTAPQPSKGVNYAYVDSEVSPYESPTDYAEYVVLPKIHLGAEYYNEGDKTVIPVVNLFFCVYWVTFFDPRKARHRERISRIANREVPAAFMTVGFATRPLDLAEVLTGDDWNVELISMEEAMNL